MRNFVSNIKINSKRILSLVMSTVILCSGFTVYAGESVDENDDKKIVVEATAQYPVGPDIDAKAGILMDADTGAILYQKNIHEKLYPASITKIMTALLAVEHCALEDTFTFTADIINGLPWDAAKYGYVAGEEVNVKDLLHTLLLRSANEVAIGFGIKISGTEEEFGKLMTQRAKEAGAINTNFTNASGLHDDKHYTTAYDMAMIAKEASKNATLASVWGKDNYIVSPTNVEPDVVRIWNRHDLLVKTRVGYYQYAKGGKTGYTDEAGRTLVTYASKDGMNLICVVMKTNTEASNRDTRALFEYGFNNFTKVSAEDVEERFGQSGDSYFISRDHLFNQASKLIEIGADYITIPNDIDMSTVGYELSYDSDITGNHIADISYKIGDYYLGKTTLKLNADSYIGEEISPYKKEEPKVEDKGRNQLIINIWWVAGIVLGFIVLIIVIKILKKTSSRRKAKRDRKKLFKKNRLR